MFDYRLDYQANNKNRITYTGSYGRTNQQAEASLRGNVKPQRIVKDTNAHQLIRWDSTIDRNQSFVLKYFYNLLDEQDDYDTQTIDIPPLDPFSVPIYASFKSQRHNIEFTHFINPNTSTELVWGISGQHDKIDSRNYFSTSGGEKRTTWRLFGNAIFDLDQSNTIDVGILLEKSNNTDTDVSPRIAFIHKFNKQHSLRLGISKAIRTPFMFEQNGNVTHSQDVTIGGTPAGTLTDVVYYPLNNLVTEKITSYEISYYGKILENKLLINARLFQDRLQDLIDAPEDPDPTGNDNVNGEAFIFDNLHATTVHGIEAEMDYKINSSSRLVASGAILNIFSDDNPVTGKSIEYEESSPDYMLSILGMHSFNDKYSGSAGFYYIGDMAWMDANSNQDYLGNDVPNRNTGDYQILDLRLVRNFKVGDEKGSIAIVLKNLLDDYSDYDAVQNSPTPVVIQNTIAFIELKLKLH